MFLFFAYNFDGSTAFLDQNETIHCKNVLRKKVGEKIYITDFKGKIFRAVINSFHKKETQLSELKLYASENPPRFKIHVAIAPTKNISRIEWLIEKLTEIGIQEISFIKCKNSERKNIKIERLNKIVCAAAKQSLKTYLPDLNELCEFNKFIHQEYSAEKYIAHCHDAEKTNFNAYLNKQQDILIMIGPEGDFDLNEIESALDKGFKAISLGKERLRTETAALTACILAKYS